jgi:hypothetical protein
MFSRPLYHAEEEIYGPGPPSSRFRLVRISADNQEFVPKLKLYHFFVVNLLYHMRVFSGPNQHPEEEYHGLWPACSRYLEICISDNFHV